MVCCVYAPCIDIYIYICIYIYIYIIYMYTIFASDGVYSTYYIS